MTGNNLIVVLTKIGTIGYNIVQVPTLNVEKCTQ